MRTHILSWKRILYTLCFFFFCLIDNRVKNCSGLDGLREIYRDLMGVMLAIIIISNYKPEDIKRWKLPYLIWSIVSIIGGSALYFLGKERVMFPVDLLVIIVDVVLFGYILIHTFIRIVIEKNKPRLNKKFTILWGIMMLLMMFSGGRYLWPFCYFAMFGCFYVTDFTKQEQEDLFHGMLNGIILSFFIFQGHCFVLRPYDYVGARYRGFFANSNWNALYYLEVLAAVFAKLIYVYRNQCGKWIKLYYWLGAGVVLSFEFMTIGRSGWVTAFVMVVLFLWFMGRLQEKKRYLKNVASLILCFVLTFPLCFSAARYLPPVFHHVLWFYGEWNEGKVHSWDKWDSEKFIDIDEFFDAALGRIAESVGSLLGNSPFAIRSEAAELTDETMEAAPAEPTATPDPRIEAAVLTHEQAADSYIVRSTIYKYYFTHLKLWGQPYEEQGFQITPTYWIGHAHNIFLQYGTDFGIIAMVLFGGMVIGSCVDYKRQYAKKCSEQAAGLLFFVLIPAVFGMFEFSWGVGSLTITMLFLAWRGNIVNEQE